MGRKGTVVSVDQRFAAERRDKGSLQLMPLVFQPPIISHKDDSSCKQHKKSLFDIKTYIPEVNLSDPDLSGTFTLTQFDRPGEKNKLSFPWKVPPRPRLLPAIQEEHEEGQPEVRRNSIGEVDQLVLRDFRNADLTCRIRHTLPNPLHLPGAPSLYPHNETLSSMALPSEWNHVAFSRFRLKPLQVRHEVLRPPRQGPAILCKAGQLAVSNCSPEVGSPRLTQHSHSLLLPAHVPQVSFQREVSADFKWKKSKNDEVDRRI